MDIQWIILIVIIAFLVYLYIQPQRKHAKHVKMINALQIGDRVITAGGIIGEITLIQPDYFVIQSEDTIMKTVKWVVFKYEMERGGNV